MGQIKHKIQSSITCFMALFSAPRLSGLFLVTIVFCMINISGPTQAVHIISFEEPKHAFSMPEVVIDTVTGLNIDKCNSARMPGMTTASYLAWASMCLLKHGYASSGQRICTRALCEAIVTHIPEVEEYELLAMMINDTATKLFSGQSSGQVLLKGFAEINWQIPWINRRIPEMTIQDFNIHAHEHIDPDIYRVLIAALKTSQRKTKYWRLALWSAVILAVVTTVVAIFILLHRHDPARFASVQKEWRGRASDPSTLLRTFSPNAGFLTKLGAILSTGMVLCWCAIHWMTILFSVFVFLVLAVFTGVLFLWLHDFDHVQSIVLWLKESLVTPMSWQDLGKIHGKTGKQRPIKVWFRLFKIIPVPFVYKYNDWTTAKLKQLQELGPTGEPVATKGKRAS